jgi:uncharacterized protein
VKQQSMVFDAWALVAYFKNERPAADRVEEILHQAAEHEVILYVSLINLGEVYYSLGRTLGHRIAEQTLQQIQRLPIQLLAVGEAQVLQAAEYKMTYPISYADAFALGAAIANQATLLTGDPELNRLQQLVAIEFLQRS